VICFEPNPGCVDTLNLEIRANKIENIQVHNVGLGAMEGTLTLAVPYINSGQGTFSESLYDSTEAYRITVPVKTGDSMLVGINPSFVKIDVEGFELNVLRGLSTTLAQAKPIVTHEVYHEFMKSLGYTFNDIRKYMTALGYRGYRLGLRRKGGRYDWALTDYPGDATNCDVAWLHESTLPLLTRDLADHFDYGSPNADEAGKRGYGRLGMT
jgi:FkbM family methyltransferase